MRRWSVFAVVCAFLAPYSRFAGLITGLVFGLLPYVFVRRSWFKLQTDAQLKKQVIALYPSGDNWILLVTMFVGQLGLFYILARLLNIVRAFKALPYQSNGLFYGLFTVTLAFLVMVLLVRLRVTAGPSKATGPTWMQESRSALPNSYDL